MKGSTPRTRPSSSPQTNTEERGSAQSAKRPADTAPGAVLTSPRVKGPQQGPECIRRERTLKGALRDHVPRNVALAPWSSSDSSPSKAATPQGQKNKTKRSGPMNPSWIQPPGKRAGPLFSELGSQGM